MRVYVLKVKWWYLFLILLLAFLSIVPQVRTPLIMSVLSRGRLVPIYDVKTAEKKLAISFDATWGTDLTDEILGILAEHDIKTTFFLAGYWVDKHPEYVVKIAAAGHEIGNHSYSHPHMNTLNEQGIAFELQKNEHLIRDLTGQQTTLFRPPFGEYNNQVISVATSLGYHTIQWSVDSLDWKNLTSAQIYERVMSQVKPGSIVLFHNAAPGTPGAIRRLIPDLLSQGYAIVPISELLHKGEYYIDHAGTQHPGKGGS
ncbi:MAG TPA: polysaccharide deacetylase family protein [Firmicutes bacterium]|jgi:polysaccharide deacetylase family sporulation protein PdaB|nr:polysaccharide deacetylase family protein [Bacillota bacterium]